MLIAFLMLMLFAFFGWNNVIELRAEEPRRAIVSMEMTLSGNYLVPKIHGWNYYNKPPVFNWVMILFFKLFGSFEEWVVRFPSLLAFLLTALLNFFIVKRFLKGEVALLSSLFFLSSADLLFYGTINAGEIDLFYSFLVYMQAMAVFWFFEKKQFGRLFLISYLLAAAGTLTKGPPSILFQGLTLLPWFLINREWRVLFSWKHFLAIALYVLVTGGYFYWYSFYGDSEGFMVRLFKEASMRSGMEHNFWDTLGGMAGFPFLILKLLAPWSIFLVLLFKKDVLKGILSNPLLQFCAVFILFNIPVYWISADHKARYLYMFFPFFCIVLSFLFFHKNEGLEKWKSYIFRIFFGVMLFGTAAFLGPPFLPQTADLPYIILKCAAILLAGTTLIVAFRKYPGHKIYFFILFIFLMRIGYNFTYLPALARESSQLIYRDHIGKVLEITGSAPVHWCGEPYTFESDASIGPFTFKYVKHTSPTQLAFQIPYYLTKGNGHIMQFDTSLKAGQFYLAHEDFIRNMPVKVLYSFPDKWMLKEVILFKTNPEGN